MASKRIDVSSLGLRVGLEIHQQLDTKHKLFCRCPTTSTPGDIDEFERRLRPTKSELGEVDIAALFEWKRGRVYHYKAPRNISCLVEADEEPPHQLNREALVIALAIAKALGSIPVDEVYVMRKIVIDGSNTTGFQRTALVALGGRVKDSEGYVGIQTICLEEDAARKIGEKDGRIVEYDLDRLGIPLIEISTSPDISSPEQAERVAFKIGQLLRLTGKVKRGIGTIRQDLNVSIRDGARIEIKGVQRLDLIAKVVEYEALRQYNLLKIRDELRARNVKEEDIKENIVDVTSIFANTVSRVLKREILMGGRVYAALLPGFAGLLGREVQPGRRFGTELADYARFWGGVSGLFHSDELPGYGIREEEIKAVYKTLGGDRERDAIVIVAAKPDKAVKALKAVIMRAREALKGVPLETRVANPDGTTRYMRPQPGSARMYPETDVPPFEITSDIIREAEKYVPEPPEAKLERFIEEYGLSKQLAEEILVDVRLDLFEKLASHYKESVSPTFIASIFVNTLRSLRREGVPVENIDDRHIEELVAAISKGAVAKEAAPEILKYLAENPGKSIEDAIKNLGLGRLSIPELEELVTRIILENKERVLQKKEKAMGFLMGRVMAHVRGRIDGKTVSEIVRKKLAEFLRKLEDKAA